MKYNYIVTNEYLTEKGLDLNEYALEGTFIQAIIGYGLDTLIDRMCQLSDNFHSEEDIEEYLSIDDEERTKEEKQNAFLKAQFRVIYNLIFTAEDSPIDQYVDGILVFQLGCKINGFQKGFYYRVQ